jgi:predicted Zn-dependent peptidase
VSGIPLTSPSTALAQPIRDIATTTLPGGVRVITETMQHVRSVAVGVWVNAGSRSEAREQNGISHFIEHMLFKGTHNRTAEDIARSVDSVGGNLDAFTSKELVCFNTKILDEHVEYAFDVLADLVLNPLFREDDIEKEKGVILEELKMDVDNPDYLVHEIFSSNFWIDNAIGRPILGTKETVKAFDQSAIRGFYESVYTPANLLITAAGNLDHEHLLRLVRDRFSSLVPRDAAPLLQAPVTQAKISLKHKKDLEQAHLCLGVPCYPASHDLRFACYILNTVLGGGMSSRLFQNIREQLGLAYAVFSDLSPYRDTGCLSVYAGTATESARQVIDLILQEFRNLKNDLIPADELRRAKDHLKGSMILGLESSSSRMSNLARQELYHGRFYTSEQIGALVEAVTAEDVREVARTFFHQELVALTVLGNLENFNITREELVC